MPPDTTEDLHLRVVKRALIAVSDKSGIVELCSCLAQMGIEIVSTGGTAATLREGGIEVQAVEDITG
ncbi:MAG TPA: bifunctional phosphoribosylaminoimidazolecarboxamide formyltransferase/IMP cyclohydrolase, partial [Planctomycetes bacterium]|nr:bifunctional phosphoribosylaminoimidazolecarboxamide formyltransferase/IMP cyclohydrolase [Planctomycetota bacterium]